MIHIVLWTAIALNAAGALSTVALIGKEREPVKHGTAVLTSTISGLMIAGYAYVLLHI